MFWVVARVLQVMFRMFLGCSVWLLGCLEWFSECFGVFWVVARVFQVMFRMFLGCSGCWWDALYGC